MAKILPLTDFQIGRDNYRTDFQLFQDWAIDMRDVRIDGKAIATGKRAMPLWHNATRVEIDPNSVTCKMGDDGQLNGPAKRLDRLNELQAAYASGEYESFAVDYNEYALADGLLEAAKNHVDNGQNFAKMVELDWSCESVASL